MMFLKFIIPVIGLIYLIRKNPFYRSYPAMLPAMIISAILLAGGGVVYSKQTNKLVRQILLDPTGTELTFVYANQISRRLRNDSTELSMLISQCTDPPQGEDYVPLAGYLFPTKYPVTDLAELRSWGSLLFRKYYITQRQYMTFFKKSQYCNFECLIHAFNNQILDLSKAKLYHL